MRLISGICSTSKRTGNGIARSTSGASWELPMELRWNHTFRAIGRVVEISRHGDALHFEAEVTDEDVWRDMQRGARIGVSIEAEASTERDLAEWQLTAISLLGPRSKQGHPDAKIFKIVELNEKQVQQRTIKNRLKEIDAHARRLHEDLEAAQTPATMDRYNALHTVSVKLAEERRQLLERQQALEVGLADKPAPTPGGQTRAWDFDTDFPEPEFPKGARQAGDLERLEKCRKAFLDFHLNESMKAGAATSISPAAPVDFETLMLLRGYFRMAEHWLTNRCAELEQRVAELEDSNQLFAGVHQRALSYRKGALVTHAGGLWAAVTDVPEGAVPGQSDFWQLAVKRGDFA